MRMHGIERDRIYEAIPREYTLAKRFIIYSLTSYTRRVVERLVKLAEGTGRVSERVST